MTIIEQLKKNEKPFGLMSEEMQEKTKKIGMVDNFRLFGNIGWGGIIKDTGYVFFTEYTYRLRPDYAEKPEIEKCEIFSGSGDMLSCDMPNGDRHRVSLMSSFPDFIGFKFEDGIVTFSPVRYKIPGGVFSTFAYKNFAETTVLHATHVLFRRQE